MIKMTEEQVKEAIQKWAEENGHAIDGEISFDIIERPRGGDMDDYPSYVLLGAMFKIK
jgi:hypothetical protein